MKNRKIKIFLAAWILLIWGIRVINVNMNDDASAMVLSMQQTIDYDGLLVTPIESHLYTIPEYEEAMNVQLDTPEEVCIVCVKFHFQNETGEAMGWDEILDGNLGYGFESLTWASVTDPFLGADINIFYSEQLENHGEAEAWMATTVSKSCFREKNWKRLKEEEFYYVLDLYPNSVKIKLETGEEGNQ